MAEIICDFESINNDLSEFHKNKCQTFLQYVANNVVRVYFNKLLNNLTYAPPGCRKIIVKYVDKYGDIAITFEQFHFNDADYLIYLDCWDSLTGKEIPCGNKEYVKLTGDIGVCLFFDIGLN